MFKIYSTVKRVLERHYSKETDDFKRGYKTAVKMLFMGIKKSFHFNYALLAREQEEQIKELEKTIANQRKEITKLHEKNANNALVYINPSKEYNSYIVTTDEGEFEVVVNMDKSSFEFCLLNFSYRYSFKKNIECKSKLLTFINNKSALGFRAFKDKKAYKRFLDGKV